ncbi:MAG: flavodoxin domain-containing protein [Bauldia litoralis]
MELKILVGTMTGTAEMVADEMSDALSDAGHEAEVLAMDDLDASVFADGGVFLIVTSTYGQGDVPDNGLALYEGLLEQKPDLANVTYDIFSLDDMTYADTFNFGGKKFDEALTGCGAKRIGDMFAHDASSGTIPEEDGVEWVKVWIENFKKACEVAA